MRVRAARWRQPFFCGDRVYRSGRSMGSEGAGDTQPLLTRRPRFTPDCVARAVPPGTASVCIFACSGPPALPPHVCTYAAQLALHFERVVVVVAMEGGGRAAEEEGGIDEGATARLGVPNACVCTAPNGMRDFGLFWRMLTGLLVAGRRSFECVALVNDSALLVRPLQSLMRWAAGGGDAGARRPYWGVSKSSEGGLPHVQSYFLVLQGRGVALLFDYVALQDAFRRSPLPSTADQKKEAIDRFELGLARHLRAAGVPPEAPFSSPGLAQMRWTHRSGGFYGENPSHTMWDRMLAAGAPTLKRARLGFPGSEAHAMPPLSEGGSTLAPPPALAPPPPPPPLHDSTDPTVFVYISCHDDESEREARHLAKHTWRIDDDPLSAVAFIRLPPTPFLESAIYDILHERRAEWESADYVCLLTYSIGRKLEAFGRSGSLAPPPEGKWRHLRQSLTATSPDVAGLCRIDFVKKSVGGAEVPVSVLEGAVFQHGMNFYRAWHALLGAMGLDEAAILDPSVPGFFCNWWVVRPRVLLSYVAFYRRAAALVRTDPELARLMGEDAYYNGAMTPRQLAETFEGRSFYPVQPFVFERLPSLFFGRHRPALRIGVIEPRFVMRLKE